MFVVRRWPPVAVANQTATRMLFWETGNQTCSVISIWGCVKKNKLIYILMSVKKKSTLSYLCIKSYWKLELHNHIETRKTPAKICVETGLSILINQILNYNFSELTLSYVVKYDIPTHIHVLCLVRERHIWINVQTHSRKVLLMQRLHTAEIQMNSLFRLQPSIVKSTSNSMSKSCKRVVGAIFFIPLTFPSE